MLKPSFRVSGTDSYIPFNIKQFTFPDGQPHLEVDTSDIPSKGCEPVSLDIKCRLTCPNDLFQLLMLLDILENSNYTFKLHIMYLMGGRMDRRINNDTPFTLDVVTNIINNIWAVGGVEVFCPHSFETSDLLIDWVEAHNTMWELEDRFFYLGIIHIDAQYTGAGCGDPNDCCLVYPDKGAQHRFSENDFVDYYSNDPVILDKVRVMETGEITGMCIKEGTIKKYCIIVDDLCDGGRTFVEAAKLLRANGAEKVGLVVAHGVFSKGTKLDGIDYIVTSNSHHDMDEEPNFKVLSVI